MIYNAELALCKLKIPIAMKLLLILPNLVLIAVAGINLSNELSSWQINRNLSVVALHLSVLIMCLVFVSLIIKSMFKVVSKEETYTQSASEYKSISLEHTVQV